MMEAPDKGYSDAMNQATDAAERMSNARDRGQQPPKPGQAPKQAEAGDPVTSALQTVAMWIQAQIEKGNPQAEQWKASLLELLQMIQGGGKQAPAPKGPRPEEKPAPAPEGGEMSPGEEYAKGRQTAKVM